MDEKNSPVSNPLRVKWFSEVMTECLFGGEIMEEWSLHPSAFKESQGPPAFLALRHIPALVVGCQEE